MQKISENDVRAAMKKMKNGAGPDDMPVKAWQCPDDSEL